MVWKESQTQTNTLSGVETQPRPEAKKRNPVPQAKKRNPMSCGDCPVCFDELTDANYRIVCANEHQLCETCFKEQVKPRQAECDYGVGYEFRVDVSTNCPICRDPMLVWEEDLPEDQPHTLDGEDFIVVDGIIVRGLGIEMIRYHGRRPAQTQELEDASERIRQAYQLEARGRRRERFELARQEAIVFYREQREAREQEIIAGAREFDRLRAERRNAPRRCGICRRTGHNRRSCPNQ